jgi:Na+-translocating ferredoxin:NAD+ oxidoreductase subunit D
MTPTHAPHAHAPASVGQIMGTVMLALVPATLFGFWLYGWPAVFLWAVALLAALAGEAFAVKLMGRPVVPPLMDGSALLTAWLLALSLPPWAPWWIAALGSFFAVVVVKQVFGGLGQNVFNPAMAARVMLLISFPVEMTAWVGLHPLTTPGSPGFLEALGVTFGGLQLDGMASASVLGHIKTEASRGVGLEPALAGFFVPGREMADMAWGLRPGSLGETGALLLLLGGLVLIARRIITWHAPVAMLLGVALPALVASTLAPASYAGPLLHLLSGGVVLAAFFIITDPVTCPNTASGQFAFGLGVGLLTWIIRTWGGYPEGVAFAVLIMNAAVPVIDRYLKPRIYGRDRQGRALSVEQPK